MFKKLLHLGLTLSLFQPAFAVIQSPLPRSTISPQSQTLDSDRFEQIILGIVSALTRLPKLDKGASVRLTDDKIRDQFMKNLMEFLHNAYKEERIHLESNGECLFLPSSTLQLYFQFGPSSPKSSPQTPSIYSTEINGIHVNVYPMNGVVQAFQKTVQETRNDWNFNLNPFTNVTELGRQVETSTDFKQIGLYLEMLKMMYQDTEDDSPLHREVSAEMERLFYLHSSSPEKLSQIRRPLATAVTRELLMQHENLMKNQGESPEASLCVQHLQELATLEDATPYARTKAIEAVILPPLLKEFEQSGPVLFKDKQPLQSVQSLADLAVSPKVFHSVRMECVKALLPTFLKHFEEQGSLNDLVGKTLLSIACDSTLTWDLRSPVVSALLPHLTQPGTLSALPEAKNLLFQLWSDLNCKDPALKQQLFSALSSQKLSLWPKESGPQPSENLLEVTWKEGRLILPKNSKPGLQYLEGEINTALAHLSWVRDTRGLPLKIRIRSNLPHWVEIQKDSESQCLTLDIDASLFDPDRHSPLTALLVNSALTAFEEGNASHPKVYFALSRANVILNQNHIGVFDNAYFPDSLHSLLKPFLTPTLPENSANTLRKLKPALATVTRQEWPRQALLQWIDECQFSQAAQFIRNAIRHDHYQNAFSTVESTVFPLMNALNSLKSPSLSLHSNAKQILDCQEFILNTLTFAIYLPGTRRAILSDTLESAKLDTLAQVFPDFELITATQAHRALQSQSLLEILLSLKKEHKKWDKIISVLQNKQAQLWPAFNRLYEENGKNWDSVLKKLQTESQQCSAFLNRLKQAHPDHFTLQFLCLRNQPPPSPISLVHTMLGAKKEPASPLPASESFKQLLTQWNAHFEVLSLALTQGNSNAVEDITTFFFEASTSATTVENYSERDILRLQKKLLSMTMNYLGFSDLAYTSLALMKRWKDQRISENESEEFETQFLRFLSRTNNPPLVAEYYKNLLEWFGYIATIKLTPMNPDPDNETFRQCISCMARTHAIWEQIHEMKEPCLPVGLFHYWRNDLIPHLARHLMAQGHPERVTTYLDELDTLFKKHGMAKDSSLLSKQSSLIEMELRWFEYQKNPKASLDPVLQGLIGTYEQMLSDIQALYPSSVGGSGKISRPMNSTKQEPLPELADQIKAGRLPIHHDLVYRTDWNNPKNATAICEMAQRLFNWAKEKQNLHAGHLAFDFLSAQIGVVLPQAPERFSLEQIKFLMGLESECCDWMSGLSERLYDPSFDTIQLYVKKMYHLHALHLVHVAIRLPELDDRIACVAMAHGIQTGLLQNINARTALPPSKAGQAPRWSKEEIYNPDLKAQLPVTLRETQDYLGLLMKEKGAQLREERAGILNAGKSLPSEVLKGLQEILSDPSWSLNLVEKYLKRYQEEQLTWKDMEGQKRWDTEALMPLMTLAIERLKEKKPNSFENRWKILIHLCQADAELLAETLLKKKETATVMEMLKDFVKQKSKSPPSIDDLTALMRLVSHISLQSDTWTFTLDLIFEFLNPSFPSNPEEITVLLSLLARLPLTDEILIQYKDKLDNLNKLSLSEEQKSLLAQIGGRQMEAYLTRQLKNYGKRPNPCLLDNEILGQSALVHWFEEHPGLSDSEADSALTALETQKLDEALQKIHKIPSAPLKTFVNQALKMAFTWNQLKNIWGNVALLAETIGDFTILPEEERWNEVLFLPGTGAIDTHLLSGRFKDLPKNIPKELQDYPCKDRAGVAVAKLELHVLTEGMKEEMILNGQKIPLYQPGILKGVISAAASKLSPQGFRFKYFDARRYEKLDNLAHIKKKERDELVDKTASNPPESFETWIRDQERKYWTTVFPQLEPAILESHLCSPFQAEGRLSWEDQFVSLAVLALRKNPENWLWAPEESESLIRPLLPKLRTVDSARAMEKSFLSLLGSAERPYLERKFPGLVPADTDVIGDAVKRWRALKEKKREPFLEELSTLELRQRVANAVQKHFESRTVFFELLDKTTLVEDISDALFPKKDSLSDADLATEVSKLLDDQLAEKLAKDSDLPFEMLPAFIQSADPAMLLADIKGKLNQLHVLIGPSRLLAKLQVTLDQGKLLFIMSSDFTDPDLEELGASEDLIKQWMRSSILQQAFKDLLMQEQSETPRPELLRALARRLTRMANEVIHEMAAEGSRESLSFDVNHFPVILEEPLQRHSSDLSLFLETHAIRSRPESSLWKYLKPTEPLPWVETLLFNTFMGELPENVETQYLKLQEKWGSRLEKGTLPEFLTLVAKMAAELTDEKEDNALSARRIAYFLWRLDAIFDEQDSAQLALFDRTGQVLVSA